MCVVSLKLEGFFPSHTILPASRSFAHLSHSDVGKQHWTTCLGSLEQAMCFCAFQYTPITHGREKRKKKQAISSVEHSYRETTKESKAKQSKHNESLKDF